MAENKENKELSEVIKENKAKVILGAVALALIIIIIAIAARSGGNSGSSSESGGSAQVAEGTEIPQITPIFMYFVSQYDEGYDEYMAMIEELKTEYDGRVEFQITDVDENPEAKDNFPVEGNTPLLIMNNHDNNITAIEFSCADKAKLTEDIEAAFE
ncbi:MAG: hypothetical protein ACI4EA_10720 [Candidatus Ornithomonoglobus sp.]